MYKLNSFLRSLGFQQIEKWKTSNTGTLKVVGKGLKDDNLTKVLGVNIPFPQDSY